MPDQLILTAMPGIPLVQPGDDLGALILAGLKAAEITLAPGDVIAIAQKIVSKAEGRLVKLSDVTPSARAHELAAITQKDPRFVEVVLSETKEVLRTAYNTLIVQHRLGFVCANAGVDRSNVGPLPGGEGHEEYLLCLPRDPDATCQRLRERLRAVTVGVAIGAAGFPALLDMRGHRDLFDYTLQVTQIGLADELAAAASLLMGQADPGRPVLHIPPVPYPFREGSAQELIRPKEMDLFR